MTTAGPLRGVRILDLTRLLPGGYCTLVLADLGADVVKVEEPGRGDSIRWSPPMVDGKSAAHRALNRGKRSITLNLKSEGGPQLLRRLAAGADVLVESFRPGVMDRLGVGWRDLARADRLVYCAITGYGQDGPYRAVPGHDINYQGYGGALSLGPGGSEPVHPGVQVADLGAGLAAVAGILAALFERERTGRRAFVDVSMLDAVASWLSIHLGNHLADPDGVRPLSGDLACYRVYRTKDDRHVTVGALEPPFWQALCQGLDLPDLADDQFAPPERQAQVAARIQEVFGTRTRDEWMEVFAALPACVGPVNDLDEVLADPQVRHRGMIAEVDGVPVGPGSPIRVDRRTPPAGRPAPALGQHTDEVLSDAGLTRREIVDLRTRGVV